MSKLIKTEQELEGVLKSRQKALVLFYATWCPFCARFLPAFEKHCPDAAGYFYRMETDEAESVEEKYSINVVPTVLYFENGQVTRRLDGVAGIGLREEQLADIINACSLPER